jgi:hypothetical protein
MKKKRRSKIYSLSCGEFKELVSRCSSYSEVLRELGLVSSGGSSSKGLKRRIEELSCCVDHFNTEQSILARRRSIPIEEILTINSSYTNIAQLKKRLRVELNYPQYCNICGMGDEWNGHLLVLQLDHVNGISNDHRLENLRLLCPNCHSQTDTYAGKNNKSPRPL